MEKINFTNGQAPALNGTNLNQLQDNVETAINGVAESGSNTNGKWIKFSDGTIICHGLARVPAGGGYAEVTLPQNVSDYSILLSAGYNTTPSVMLAWSNATTTGFNIYARGAGGSTLSVEQPAYWQVIGKWK